MTTVSLSWDTQKGSVCLRYKGLFSLGWEKGKILARVLGLPIKIPIQNKSRPPVRWRHLRRFFRLLRQCKIRKVEGTFSFENPMVNGLLYGWMSAIQAAKGDPRPDPNRNITVNFLGENRCKGEVEIPAKTLFSEIIRRR